MSINSPTGILDVTNATIRAGKLESTGDITCSSNLVVSGGFDLSAINSNADTVVDFTATRQLRKYPREILTSDSQNGYTITASENTNTSKHRAFNENTYATNERWVSQWVSGTGGRYDRTTGFYDGATYDDCLSTSSGTPEGEWLAIQVPEAFVLHSFEIVANSSTNSMDDPIARGQAPRDFQVWGSNDGTAWTKVFEIEDADAPSGVRAGRTFYTSGVTTTAYNRYALIVTRNGATYPNATQWADVVTVGELRYYGYGQDGDGQDVRLRAHANAPNTDFLEVHFDANVSNSYPGSGTTLTDVSGEAHHATLNNGVGFDSTYGALTFNGSNQNVNTQALGISGDFVHTASLWVKPAVNQSALSATDLSAFFYIGQETYADVQGIAISYRKDELRYWFGGNDVDVTTDFKANEWVHIAVVYRGGGGTAVNRDVYVNGVKQRYLRTSGSSYGNVLNVQSTAFLRLGGAHGTNAAPYQDFNGSIANFRLFKRPLIEAEIHQLYDWEKVRFGRVALGDVVAFRDGSLGVGVAEPSRDDRLVVDGRAKADSVKTPVVVDRNDVVVYEQTGPHDRPLVKYPEIAMTASTVGGYTISEPTNTFHSNSSFRLWKAFNNDTGTPDWETVGGSYDTGTRNPQTSGSYAVTTVVSGTTYYGVYAQMLAPIGVKVSHVDIRPQNTYGLERLPGIAVFAGSDDGTTWTLIRSVTNNSGALNTYTRYNVNATQAYKYIRIIWNKLTSAGTTTSYRNRAAASEIKIFGTEQGDVSTDSTWTSLLNKPGTQHLEVYWDGADSNSYPGAGTEVFDLSGNGVKGTITGNNGFDSTYNAWTFDGSGDYISTTSSGLGTGGAFDHSFAFWFKINRNITNNDYVVTFGEEANDNMIAVNISGNSLIHFDNWGRGVITGDIVRLGIWYHVACTHTGSATGNVDTQLIYVNGVKQPTGSTGTGTLAFTSDRITIGARPGTNNSNTPGAFLDGAVANVRFFKGKVLNAAQVKELYAYDAVRFGHRASNSVTLYKGNLGLGVAEPTARLEIAGNERIQEYPPRAMSEHDTYMEGHGVFKARWANWYSGNTPTGMYNKQNAVGGQENIWYGPYNGGSTGGNGTAYSGGDVYSGTDFAASTTSGLFLDDVNGNRYHGAWTTLEMPYDILLQRIHLYQGAAGENISSRCITEDGVILGSANGHEWHHVHTFEGLQYGGTLGSYSFDAAGESVTVNATTPYKHYALVTTRTLHYAFTVIIGELIWFGTPASSTLDDGHLTLGKTLTTPRVSGHAAGAETPRAESLVVHYDTVVDSVVSGNTVVDTSGSGNNGTFRGNPVYSSADRAVQFDGSGDCIISTGVPTASGSGNFTHTVSMWFKLNAIPSSGTSNILWGLVGENDGTDGSPSAYGAPHSIVNASGNISWAMWGDDIINQTAVVANRWYHCVWTYSGGTSGRKMFLNGVEQTFNTSQSVALNMQNSTSRLTIGIYPHDLTTSSLNGSISNFKLRNVALTASEITTEYTLGRMGKALNVTDTAVCLGGTAPRAQLDVRGTARFENIMGGFPSYNKTTWAGVTSTTIPLDPDRFSVHKIFVRGKMTSPTGDSTRRCRIRPKTEGNTAFMATAMESWSHAHRRGSATTIRAVYDGTDGPFMFGGNWGSYDGTEANCTFSAEITVYNRFNDGGTCYRSQFMFECAHTLPYTGIEVVRGACQPNLHPDQNKKIIELSLVFSSSGGTGSAAASGECIICGLN